MIDNITIPRAELQKFLSVYSAVNRKKHQPATIGPSIRIVCHIVSKATVVALIRKATALPQMKIAIVKSHIGNLYRCSANNSGTGEHTTLSTNGRSIGLNSYPLNIT
jgi:hypothetical protein